MPTLEIAIGLGKELKTGIRCVCGGGGFLVLTSKVEFVMLLYICIQDNIIFISLI